MTARLPTNRIVDVTLTRLDRFATTRGFGVPLILSTDATGAVDATDRTKVYGSLEEVADDYADTTEPYKAAAAIFAQNPRPRQIKIGFVNAGVLTTPTPSPTITAELDAVYAYDNEWYWLTFTEEFRDLDIVDDIFAWVETKPKLCVVASNAVGTQNPADTATVAARNKNLWERSAVFYHPTASAYPDMALVARASRFDFDLPNDAYTMKFKRLNGIPLMNVASAGVQGATGFVPAVGLSAAAGHFANVYVDIGGLPMVVEGTMLNGRFIDEQHFSDWLIARTEENVLSTLANQRTKVPYTDAGIQILVGAVETTLRRAVIAGAIAEDVDPVTGDLLPPYRITTERVLDVPASQRSQRIAPAIDAEFRLSGAVHYASVRLLARV